MAESRNAGGRPSAVDFGGGKREGAIKSAAPPPPSLPSYRSKNARHNMDDDFAFDLYCDTEEEWREKQVDWQRFMREVAQRQ